jgi:hypothetical protein
MISYWFNFFPATRDRHATALILYGSDKRPTEIVHRLKSAIVEPCITTLILRGVNFEDSALRQAACSLFQCGTRQWETIEISNATLSESLHMVLQAVVSTNGKRLLLRDCTIDRNMAATLQKALDSSSSSQLTKLDLSSSRLTVGGVAVLVEGLRKNTKLEHLVLFACRLEDSHISRIAEALQSHPSLKELHLGCNRCRSGGLRSISTLLSSDPQELQVVDLVDQGLEQGQTLDVSLLESGLSANINLLRLTLSSNRLSGISSLSLSLTFNKSLRSLRLNSCRLSNNDIKSFAQAFPDMVGLKRLWLSGSQQWDTTTSEGINILATIRDGLLRNYCLVEIHFPSLVRQDETIQHLLDWNQGGRRLLMAPSDTFPSACWPLVLERAMRLELSRGIKGDIGARRMNIVYQILRNVVLLET